MIKMKMKPQYISFDNVIQPTWDVITIEEEPMFYSASIEFARKHGGELTKLILDRISPAIKCPPHLYPVIDTRSHMLMKGMYPAIPGWHCDGVMRNSIGQPDFDEIDPAALNYTITVSSEEGGVSNTEFISEPVEFSYEPERVWGSMNDYLEKNYDLSIFRVPDGTMVNFNQEAIHRATSATKNGWRWFFRLSLYHSAPRNRIRNQVQVYTNSSLGW